MKNLIQWQFISLMSRGIAMGLGIFQSFFIVRLLTVGEYGLVQIAASVGGAFGIYQHLGLASGSTREISSAKDDTEIFKIFLTSVFIRYLVTLPIAIFLFVSAQKIAVGQYNQEALVTPIKIYAIVLAIQGVQSILNSVIAGTKRFKTLFIYQAAVAIVSVVLYIPLVYFFRINGYFYALLAFNLLASIILAIIAFAPLRGKLVMPDIADFKRLLRELLSISLAIYAVKVIYTMWEKSGPIILGKFITPELVGIFAFALLFAKKIVNASDAVTDINLPVFSEKFVHNIDEFKSLFTHNFNKVFSFIMFAGFSAIFWSSEVITFVVGGDKYNPAFPLILPLVFTFIFYSFTNIIKSSIYIPAKFVKEMMLGFVLLLLITIGGFAAFKVGLNMDFLFAMTYGMFFGSLGAFIYLVLFSHSRLQMKYITHEHVLIFVQALFIGLAKDVLNFWAKIPLYLAFVTLYIWALYISKFITREELALVKNKMARLVRKVGTKND